MGIFIKFLGQMSKSINFIIIDNNIRDFIEYLNKNDHLSIDKYDLLKKLIEDKEFLEINSKIPKKKTLGFHVFEFKFL